MYSVPVVFGHASTGQDDKSQYQTMRLAVDLGSSDMVSLCSSR